MCSVESKSNFVSSTLSRIIKHMKVLTYFKFDTLLHAEIVYILRTSFRPSISFKAVCIIWLIENEIEKKNVTSSHALIQFDYKKTLKVKSKGNNNLRGFFSNEIFLNAVKILLIYYVEFSKYMKTSNPMLKQSSTLLSKLEGVLMKI